MVETKDYIYGTITVFMLVMLGVTFIPTDNFYCESNKETMKCDRLSSTQLTCYPTGGTTIGKKYCSTGWIFIEEQQISDKESNIEQIKKISGRSQCFPADDPREKGYCEPR